MNRILDLRLETRDKRFETGDLRRKIRYWNTETGISGLKSQVSSLKSCVYLSLLQTPVFKGEERSLLKEVKQIISSLLGSEIFLFAILGIGIIIGLLFLYNRRKTIHELEVQLIQEDTWFTTRDDNNRIGIVVSVNLRNRSTRGIRIVDCRLSGYSAREEPEEICLEGPEEQQKLNFPGYKHFCKTQGEFYLGPYSSETLWFYYESRAVTMRNLLQAPFTIRDSERRRKSIRVRIPRHADQIAIYREMAKMW